jgi:hypothetical protein
LSTIILHGSITQKTALNIILSKHSPGENEENNEILCQDTWSASRDLNSGPPEYDAEVLTTQQRRSAIAV